jgi:hypothetical protein
MDFVAVREFRLRPGKVWQKLRKSKRLVVTSNGKPLAMLSDLRGKDIEEEMKAESIAKGIVALAKIREQARKNGTANLTMEDIDREIQAARKARHNGSRN